MKLVSLNIKVVCNSPKRVALKGLIERVNPDLVLLQETMVNASYACDCFSENQS